ncbi:MAG: metal-dependent transcriptional regulator [Candidatus Odinarchaeum yellowstonii]|jgi:DtxR family Mn-dependent transcriptional regulator|uniref:Metal-dependent transcriptional regulator n=1 Tax=Odinarchaeota yellowstonii (strain LCB_4) TaxID=1841599 RepID=A0AAF0D2I1_ODILC|nr:MAG: metal-dependent transcriptional regulator [Candidatus Odinarchaeum yellowstonii]
MMKMKREDNLTDMAEDYIAVIYRLYEKKNTRVKISELTKYIPSSPSTITEMIQRLAAKKYLEYEPFKGVKLSQKGVKLAEKILRRHRIIERFLTDILDLNPADAHIEACKLEHSVSPVIEEKLYQVLHKPATCPHGNEIDTRIKEQRLVDMYSLDVNEKAVIKKFLDEREEVLKSIYSLGLKIGEIFKITSKDEHRILVNLENRKPTLLDRRLAETILVEKII